MAARRALLSVWDKRDLIPFATGLVEKGFELISTGGTARALTDAGLPVMEVSELTGFPEILGGRVKTLHPAVHGGLLGRPDEPADAHDLDAHGIQPIELVVVNLYPFEATACQPNVTAEELIEQIDIGGVTLLRAGGKNCAYVTVVCDPADYAGVLADLETEDQVPLIRRRALAVKAFGHTARYDTAIAATLPRFFTTEPTTFAPLNPLTLFKVATLRYGENPHQQAALYARGGSDSPLGGRQLQGKELSYNNLLDLDAAWRMALDFDDPAVVIVKHNNPCGLATAPRLADAGVAALASDPVSAFGSVIAVNRPFDEDLLVALGDLFIEAIAAPAFEPAALTQLSHRTNCRLLEMDLDPALDDRFEYRSVRAGMLVQELDAGYEQEDWTVVSERQPTAEELDNLRFAWRVAKHVKSNAIVFAKDHATVGIGAGQMSRVDSVRIASFKAGERARGSVLASDAFFPFADGLVMAIEAGITAAVEPGGSMRDADAIAAANAAGIALIFTGRRHFRH